LKHFSYFIQPGAIKLKTWGDNEELLVFINPDKSLVIIIDIKGDAARLTNLQIGKKHFNVQLQAYSFNTFKTVKI
jgi:hypothetical protein